MNITLCDKLVWLIWEFWEEDKFLDYLVSCKSHDKCAYKSEGGGDRRGGGIITTGPEWCSRKECYSCQKLKEAKYRLFPRAFRASTVLSAPWFQTSWLYPWLRPSDLWQNKFLVFLNHPVCYSSHRKWIHLPSWFCVLSSEVFISNIVIF